MEIIQAEGIKKKDWRQEMKLMGTVGHHKTFIIGVPGEEERSS